MLFRSVNINNHCDDINTYSSNTINNDENDTDNKQNHNHTNSDNQQHKHNHHNTDHDNDSDNYMVVVRVASPHAGVDDSPYFDPSQMPATVFRVRPDTTYEYAPFPYPHLPPPDSTDETLDDGLQQAWRQAVERGRARIAEDRRGGSGAVNARGGAESAGADPGNPEGGKEGEEGRAEALAEPREVEPEAQAAEPVAVA